MAIFSKRENELIKIIFSRKKITIEKLTERYYKNRDDRPMNARASISDAVRRIKNKCEFHKLKWVIKSKGGGRAGVTVWQESR